MNSEFTRSNIFNEMNVYSSVEHTDDNDDIPVLSGFEENEDLLDYISLVICRRLQIPKAFKGGYLLNQMLGAQSRQTHDVDFSISDENGYEQVKLIFKEIADNFLDSGIIHDYKIKPTISSTSSGGIDFFDELGHKILGIDVGLHSLSWGITSYNFEISELPGFTVERMLSDKIIAILSRKRFRRTKDLYDFWVITNNFDFDYQKLGRYIELRGGAEWQNIPFDDAILTEYSKAWNKLILQTPSGTMLQKPEFNSVLERFYYVALALKGNEVHAYWKSKTLGFVD